MKCLILLYGILSSYTIFICSALDLDALELAGVKKDVAAAGSVPLGGSLRTSKKETLVTELIKRVCNIAKGALKLASPAEKAKLLTEIEERLRASTQVHDLDRDMYVELIMKGIKVMVLKSDTSICQNTNSESHIKEYLESNKIKTRRNMDGAKENNAKSELRKLELANQVEAKMEYLVNKTLENATTDDEKQLLVAKVKAKVTRAFEDKETLREFVKTSFQRAIEKALTKSKPNTRRQSLNDILIPKVPETVSQNHPTAIDEDELGDLDIAPKTTESTVPLTTPHTCDGIKRNACNWLKELSEFKCSYDDHMLPLRVVCDGSIDCADGTDEIQCEQQAAQRITNSSDFIEHLKLNKECFENIHKNSLLSHQGAMLSGVLKTQLEFIQKYTVNNADPNFIPTAAFKMSVDEIAKELLLITKTFNLAMTGALCMDANDEADTFIDDEGRKLDWELAKIEKQMKISPKSCLCEGKACITENCTIACQRVCYQKYSLVRFACKATSGDGSVPLNHVCDGKYDCTDETDEANCVSDNNYAPRFEAGNIYSSILKSVQAKFISKEFEPIWNHMKTLYNIIEKVQKSSMNRQTRKDTFREMRNECFNWLVKSFIDLLDITRNAEEVEDAYEFFMSVNQKLISAMKRSQTGNENMISENECFCRGIECATPICSKRCKVQCAINRALTTYACGNLTAGNNAYVDIEHICNGKTNCPKGEDELDCKSEEICRSHHLMVLRHAINKLDDRKFQGTILGEVFKAWRTKVTSILIIAEKTERPTPLDIKTLIKTIVENLVTAYVNMYDQRKVAKPQALHNAYRRFEKLSQNIMEHVKSCGK